MILPPRRRKNKFERRSTGGQSLVPPTVYPADPAAGRPDPEPSVWLASGPPGRVTIRELDAALGQLDAALIVAEQWSEGVRHAAALALAGGLLQDGLTTGQAERFVRGVCAAAEDDEVE